MVRGVRGSPRAFPIYRAVLTSGGACFCCRDREKDADGMAFIPYCSEFGGDEDPLAVLVEVDQIDEFRMLSTQVESARAANVRQAEENLGRQPRLRELQEAIRILREGGEVEAAEAELDLLRVQKQEREQRYDRDTLRRMLRAAGDEAEAACERLASQLSEDAWQDADGCRMGAERYLEEKMRHLRRKKLLEKMQALR